MLALNYRTILSVAIPLMGATFIQSLVMLTDSAFLSRYHITAYDAAGNGGLIYIALFVAMAGMNEGVQIIMARRIGEGRQNLLSSIFSSALFLNAILAILLFLCIEFLVPSIIHGAAKSARLATLETNFTAIRGLGFFPAIVSAAINAYFYARGKTGIVLIYAALMAGTNIFLDYSLIFGEFSFPQWGLEGAGYASVYAETVGAIFLIYLFVHHNRKSDGVSFSFVSITLENVKRILKLGSPILLQGIIALSTWTVFFFWIEQIGEHELTVSQNIRVLYFLAFVPIWGFSATTKTYISQYLGKKDEASVKVIIRRIQFLTVTGLFLIFHGALFYPEVFIKMVNPDPAYLKESAELLRFLYGSMLMYGLSNVYLATISGSGNTRITFIIELVAVTLYLVFAYLFIRVWNYDIYWVWSIEYIYFGIIGVLSIVYLSFFNWKKKTI